MSRLLQILNKNFPAQGPDDYHNLQTEFQRSELAQQLSALNPTQWERLMALHQLVKAEGLFEASTATHWAMIQAHVEAGHLSSNTLAYWRYQCLAAQVGSDELFSKYEQDRAGLSGPLALLLDALFLLDAQWCSQRTVDHTAQSLVHTFKRLAQSLHMFEFDEIEMLERSIFAVQMAFRFELLQAGKQNVKLKEGEKVSLNKKINSHALFMVPADAFLQRLG